MKRAPRTRARNLSRRRRIAVVTGSRAEYGILRTVIDAIERHPRLKLHLVVTGMHLLKKFGLTVDEIVDDGYAIAARVPMQRGDDSPIDQAEGVSRGVSGIAKYLVSADVNVVVVLGDRIEAMAGALAGVTTGRLVAHIHGGDIAPGDIDDSLRHAITKLSHLHFPATPAAADRLIRMGEDRSRVHMVGAPGFDRLRELMREHRRDSRSSGWALVVQHPCGRDADVERGVMRMILNQLDQLGINQTIVYPNTDRGHTGIIRAIQEHADAHRDGTVEVEQSLDRDTYLRLLLNSELLIGNSSSGIIEAPFAGVPSVNVGSRQQGRDRLGKTVFDAQETPASILTAIINAMSHGPITPRAKRKAAVSAGDLIADRLAKAPMDETFRRKVLSYQS